MKISRTTRRLRNAIVFAAARGAATAIAPASSAWPSGGSPTANAAYDTSAKS